MKTHGETFEKRRLLPAQLNPYLIFNEGPISALGSNFNPPPNFGGLILEILHVCLPALWNAKHIPPGWLKFSPAFTLNKIEHFSKVSWS
jgi:hypothetical protein